MVPRFKCNYGNPYAILVIIIYCIATSHINHTTAVPSPIADLSNHVDAQVTVVNEIESFVSNPHYLTNKEIGQLFERLSHEYPQLAQTYSIGQTIQGRQIHALALAAPTPTGDLLRPMVKVLANINGDETLGRQMVLYMAEHLVTNYDNNVQVQQLLNTTEIHFVPSCNPDGFAAAKEGNCESLPNYVGRGNAVGIDLNRDFPDRLEHHQVNQFRAQTRQPETAALAEWIVSRPFVLSANFHGGAVVASYPYDNSIAHHECCEDSLTPDDRVFKQLAHTYADNHALMRLGNNCNDSFDGGITNGAHWYELSGGMQDFNYAFSNCFELTIELSCCKYPMASTLPDEWAKNKRPLIELLKQSHIGIKGLVQDSNGYPIADATIIVAGLEDKSVRTTKRGEYWRLLTPGLYSVQAAAFGYQSSLAQQVHVTNDNVEAMRLDFKLSPIETTYDGNFRKLKVERAEPADERKKLYNGFMTSTKFEHHNFTSMERYLRNISDNYPSITHLYSIGKSVEGRDLWVMEIFMKPGQHIPGIPEFKYVANMHGNEVVGREMLILLTKYLCELYGSDERITQLVNTTRMHFLYSMNPDGYEISHEGDRTSGIGRANANNIDLNRNFPDQYGTDMHNRVTEVEVAAVMNWTLSLPFVLSANLHGGSLVANYPYDDNENDFRDPYTRLRDASISGRKLNPTEDNELFRKLALVYSQAHPTMHLGKPCELFQGETFKDGITNGAQWYSVTGGMQDWNYVRAGCMEITIEMGCDKFPKTSELSQYWMDNREPLLQFIEQIHHNIHGFVHSAIGTPIVGAMIRLDNNNHTIYSNHNGDYWRLALPGRYNITVHADNFAPQRIEVEVPSVAPFSIRLDITLMPDDPQHWASANDYRIIENVVNTRYHTDSELRRDMAELENRNGQIVSFGYADNELSRNFNYLKLTSDIGEPEEHKYKILVLSSLFDTAAPLSREIVLNLARHLVEGYKLREEWEIQLLRRSVIYLMPQMQRFDEIFDRYNANSSICDPVLSDELANRILSLESETTRDMLLNFLNTERFDLMLTFTAGNSELSYPKGESIFEKFAHNIESTDFNYLPKQCNATATRQLHSETTERLTNLFYKLYNIPMYTLGLDCCRMPRHNQIASIWRHNIEKILNLFHLTDTGVCGLVRNAKGEPLRDAFVRLLEHQPLYNVTKNAARFQIMLPKGLYGLEVGAPNHESQVIKAMVENGKLQDLGVITLNVYTLIRGEVNEINGGATMHRNTIISGLVLDDNNHPIRNAKISILSPPTSIGIRNFTDSMGTYTLAIPITINGMGNGMGNGNGGVVTLKVEAPRHFEATRELHLTDAGRPINNVIFHLKFNAHVFGMPRFLFIIITSVLIIIGVVICVLCAQFIFYRRHHGKLPYTFSLLPQKGNEQFDLDDDLDNADDGETELFRSPIKRGMTIQPYFDEEQLEHILHTDDDEDDDVDLHLDAETLQQLDADDSGDEVVMLRHHNNKNNNPRRH